MIITVTKEELGWSCPFRSDVNSCKAKHNSKVNECPVYDEEDDSYTPMPCEDCPIVNNGKVTVELTVELTIV